MRHGNACTKHPRDNVRPDGRCRYCRTEAQKRYMRSCVEARRQLAAVQAALAV